MYTHIFLSTKHFDVVVRDYSSMMIYNTFFHNKMVNKLRKNKFVNMIAKVRCNILWEVAVCCRIYRTNQDGFLVGRTFLASLIFFDEILLICLKIPQT